MTTPRFSRTEIVDTASLAAATETISKQHSIHQPTLIIGSGLLGASIGLGLRSAGIEVLLSDPSPSAQAVAEDIGAGRGLTDQDQPGTVVVAAPPDVTGEEVIKALQRWPEAVVLDIASVKGAIAEELSAAFDAGRINGDDTKRY
ncbi:MAG: prephenate dehydrogenase/arogenate dehydrogenase family protein, partial [Yaniella sp.]|nr:prephenate dehydrogenase/arogenate dehydrogenase family protein [Yaniella sp.]